MATAYMILTVISTAAWLGLFLYSLPGAHRVVFGRPRRYDLLATLYTALAFSQLGYAATRLGFWAPEHYSGVELAVRILMTGFALVCVFMMVAVLRHYRRQEDVLR